MIKNIDECYVTPDQEVLIIKWTANEDKSIELWDLKYRKLIKTVDILADRNTCTVSFKPNYIFYQKVNGEIT